MHRHRLTKFFEPTVHPLLPSESSVFKWVLLNRNLATHKFKLDMIVHQTFLVLPYFLLLFSFSPFLSPFQLLKTQFIREKGA